MRSIFFGSPDFAVPSLRALCEISEVCGVVCQPDKPKGRGLALAPPPVKVEALARGLDLLQPTKMRDGSVAAWIRERAVDVAVVVAYGRILPRDILDAPRLGCINVHASLLPKYRGASPISWAIFHGEEETGVTLMQLDEGMDTGPTFVSDRLSIDPGDTTATLSTKLSEAGASLLSRELLPIVRGERVPVAQNESLSTSAPMLDKAHGSIDWKRESAVEVCRHLRAMSPWPGAFTHVKGKGLKLHSARIFELEAPRATPGEVLVADKKHLLVACREGVVELLEVQLDGRRAVSGRELVMGRGVERGDVLG